MWRQKFVDKIIFRTGLSSEKILIYIFLANFFLHKMICLDSVLMRLNEFLFCGKGGEKAINPLIDPVYFNLSLRSSNIF